MDSLCKKIDQHLLDLAWSLWTELGVAGLQSNHRDFLILPEELVLLTVILQKEDPRLRDEALDWCSRYHSWISISRLKTIVKTINSPQLTDSFSLFSSTLNSICYSNWPVFEPTKPLKCKLSNKSILPEFITPALLAFRLRTLFGVGARADLIVFFLAQKNHDCSISDATETGYSKRSIAETLEGFARASVFQVFSVRNQLRYHFSKQREIEKVVTPLPKHMPAWRHILKVVFTLRECMQKFEGKNMETKTIELHNTLSSLKSHLDHLNLTFPSYQIDLDFYWDYMGNWFADELKAFANGIKSF